MLLILFAIHKDATSVMLTFLSDLLPWNLLSGLIQSLQSSKAWIGNKFIYHIHHIFGMVSYTAKSCILQDWFGGYFLLEILKKYKDFF